MLEQFIDIEGRMGVAYERSCDFYKDFHTHDRLMLICPRGSSSMEVRTKDGKKFKVDSSSVLLVPKGLEHDDESTAAIYDTMALYPSSKLIQPLAKKLNLSASAMKRIAMNCLKIKRDDRLETYLQEYFFERVLSKRDAEDEDSIFLAKRILEKTFCILFPECQTVPESKPVPAGTIAGRAVKVIETSLFEDMDLKSIAKQAGASVSTLLRNFRKELKTTPYAYIKNRRLEEALHLLKSDKRAVGEVAVLVGYDNFGAFSEAFKAKYGKSPSQI